MSLSNLVGAAVSVVLLRGRIGGVDGTRVLRTYVRLVVAALLAGVTAWFVSAGVHGAVGFGRSAALLALVTGGSAMVLCYGTSLKLMKVEEFDLLTAPLLRRVRPR
jgi:putative peptidoglycan lipid II flippase